jgi:hypothetical protein
MPAAQTDLTRVIDMLIPDRWNQYFTELTSQLSAIRQAGIVGTVPGLTVPDGGLTVNMPFYVDIDGDDEVWSSGWETIPAKITTQKDVAAVLTRMRSWGAEDLAGMLAGDDPLGAIGRLVASYWSRKEQQILLAILSGIFGAALTDNELDASGELLSSSLMVDSIGMLGDASEKVSGIVMHSAVQFDLAKKKLLDPKPTEPGSSDAPEFSRFLGRRIIIDDGAPRVGTGNSTVYTTYFFGQGAIGYAEGSPKVPVEIEREAKKSQDVLINRRQFIMHPRGVRWIGTAAATTPSNAELATAANWERVFELKNIPIVALKHRIG